LSARNKKIVAIFVIISSLAVIFSLKMKEQRKAQIVPQAEMILTSAAKNATVGVPFKFSFFLKSTRKDLAAFDTVVSYDSTLVRIDEIKTFDVFPLYPRRLIEDFKNRFIVTGVQTDLSKEFVLKSAEIAEITATPLKTGKLIFQFEQDGRKFTNISNFKADEVPFTTNKLEVEVGE
jgi:hypothetical protein